MNGPGFGFSGFSSINGVGFGRFSNDMSFGFPSSLPRFSCSDQEQPRSFSLPIMSLSDQEQPPRRCSSSSSSPSSSSSYSPSASSDEVDNDDWVRGETPKRRTRRKLEWHPVRSEGQFCPEAIVEYINTPLSKRRTSLELNSRVKKHLLCIGWKVHSTQTGSRMCYVSPDGKTYMSLTQVCLEIKDSILPAIDDPPLMVNPQESRELSEDSEQSSQGILDYISFCDRNILPKSREKSKSKSKSKSKAKDHLKFCGWEFFYAPKKNKRELRYQAPNGKVFYSLLTACKWFAEANGDHHHLPKEHSAGSPETDNTVVQNELPTQFLQPQDNVQVLSSITAQDLKGSYQSRILVNAHGVEDSDQSRMLVKDSYQSRMLVNAQGVEDSDQSRMLVKDSYQSRMLVNAQVVEDSDQPRMIVKDSDQPRKLRIGRQEASSSSSTKSTILSCLIDSNVVQPQAKVQYRKKDGSVLKDGMITRDGIICSCCQKVYGLSSFEVHAKSTYHRPSAYLFLEDGRSLLDCQMELKGDVKVPKAKPCNKQTSPEMSIQHDHDEICSVCLDYGELLLCDECPSAFHASCLGLKECPPGDWYCPSCRCGICHTNQFDRSKNQITDKTVLCCYQCEHLYHVGCLKKDCLHKLDSFPEREWFCNYRCEQIFLGLRRILGKRVPLGFNNLSWTLLKPTKQDDSNHAALGVMHECFASLEESQTNGDLMENIIFSEWSELNRLNFQGFYTAILERNDEVVTVATLRVHGEKVAEIPLIATLFKHRKLGMCRALMNQIEKKLAELGVQRLVLPALPDAVNTWTGSFGFSEMTKDERLGFLDNTFLNFNDTVMCQKLLQLQKEDEEGVDGNIPPVVSEAVQPAEELGYFDPFYLEQEEEEFLYAFGDI